MRHSDPPESVWEDVGEAEIEPPKWLIENLLPTGITFMPGPPKSYKSALELAMYMTVCGLKHTALPDDLQKTDGEVRRVLMLSMEASAGVLRHTAKLGMGVDIPADGRFRSLYNPWKFRLDQPQQVRDLLDWCYDLDAYVLGIDPLRNCHGADENDSAAMIQMLQPIQQWAIDNDRAAVVVHHMRKLNDDKEGNKRIGSANDMRGTSALLGMADATLSVTALNHEGRIHIDAVFKRGEAWDRTIQLGIWGQQPVEQISSDVKGVFGLLTAGFQPAVIAATMKLPVKTVNLAVQQLLRMGAVSADLKPTEKGKLLVEAAVKKYTPKA